METTTRDAMLTIGPTESLYDVGTYTVLVVQESIHDASLSFVRSITVQVANNRCSPDFEPPSNSIDDEYEYEIGVDKDIVIDFKDASNGDCFFESTLEISGPTESVALYRPEILVQDLEFDQLYKKIADASLRISATSNTQAGSYDFTYTMEDKTEGIKESIKFSVEIIASEKTSSLIGGGGSSGSSSSGGDASASGSSEAGDDGTTSSNDTGSSNSTESGSGGNSTSGQSEDGTTSNSTAEDDEIANSEDSSNGGPASTDSTGESGLNSDGTVDSEGLLA